MKAEQFSYEKAPLSLKNRAKTVAFFKKNCYNIIDEYPSGKRVPFFAYPESLAAAESRATKGAGKCVFAFVGRGNARGAVADKRQVKEG